MWYVTLRNNKILIVEANLLSDLIKKISDHNVIKIECMYHEDDGVWSINGEES